jgi:hypothetical protein
MPLSPFKPLRGDLKKYYILVFYTMAIPKSSLYAAGSGFLVLLLTIVSFLFTTSVCPKFTKEIPTGQSSSAQTRCRLGTGVVGGFGLLFTIILFAVAALLFKSGKGSNTNLNYN